MDVVEFVLVFCFSFKLLVGLVEYYYHTIPTDDFGTVMAINLIVPNFQYGTQLPY